MKSITIKISGILLGAALVRLPLVAQKADSAEVQLKAAIQKEIEKGDLKGAIEMYGKVAQGSNRAVAAQALVRMGQCYETLGDQEARKAYERVVAQFADQPEAVTQARARLLVLGKAPRAADSAAATTRRLWTEKSGGVPWSWWWGSTPSPDGRFLTFIDRRTQSLGLREIATGVLKQLASLPQPAQATQGEPVFSPDGRRMIYSYSDRATSELRVISVDGGQPQVLLRHDGPNRPRPLDWTMDGRFILISTLGQDFTANYSLLSAQDGSSRSLRRVEYSPGGPWGRARISPDGRFIVCGKIASGTGGAISFPPRNREQVQSLTLALVVFPVEGGPEIQLAESPEMDREPLWMADGRTILFLSNRSGLPGLWRMAVADGRPQGRPEIVKSDIGNANKLGITRDGTFYYTVYSDRPSLYYAPLDSATGKLAGIPSEAVTRSRLAEYQTEGDWSPDGKSIVYVARRSDVMPGGATTLIVRSLADGRERTLPLDQPMLNPVTPKWSTDGRRIFVWATGFWRGAKYGLYRVDIETSEGTFLFQTPVDGIEAATATGLYRVEREGKGTRLVFRDIATGAATELLSPTEPARVLGAALSPDGSRLGVTVGNTAAGTKSIQVMPVGGGPTRTLWTLSAPDNLGGNSVTWTADGRALLCIRFKGEEETAAVDRELWRVPADGSDPTYTGLTMEMLQATRAQPNGNGVLITAGQWTTEVYALDNSMTRSKDSPRANQR